MGARKIIVATLLGFTLSLPGVVWAASGRRLKHQESPKLPELARRIGLTGTVRLEIEIAADGTVKSDKPLGGHPLLIQSAEDAVRHWRYEPGTPAKAVVEFNFK